MKLNISPRILIFLSLLFLNIISFPFLYFFWNEYNFLNWDMPGHISAINYLTENIFPFYSGWNHAEGLGFAQGLYYPSLIHYLIALLNYLFINDTILWIKIFLSLTILTLPYVIYFFIFEFLKSNNIYTYKKATTLTFLTYLLVLISPEINGASLLSFLNIGLLNSFIALPLVFLFLGFFLRFERRYSRFNEIILSFLTTLLISSHLVAGLLAVIMLTLGWIVNFHIHKFKTYFSKYLQILFIVFFSTIFFWFPFVLDSNLRGTTDTLIADIRILAVLTLLIFGLLIYIFFKRKVFFKNKSVFVLVFTLSIFVLAGIVEYLLARFSSFTFNIIHIYRLIGFSVIFLPAIAIIYFWEFVKSRQTVSNIFEKKYFKTGFLIIAFIFFAVLAQLSIFSTLPKGNIVFNKEALESIEGQRYLTLLNTLDEYYLYRASWYPQNFQEKVPYSVNILFAESSGINETLLNIKNELEELPRSEDYQDVLQKLKLFGIDYLVYPEDKYNFEFCLINQDQNTFATLYDSPIESKSKENNLVFCKIDYDLLEKSEYFLTGSFPASPYQGRIEWYDNNQKLKLLDYYHNEQGIILPVQYNPRWKAYDSSGKPIMVYRVSPNLIGVENKPDIVLHYSENWYEFALKYLSLIVILIQIIYLKFSFSRRVYHSIRNMFKKSN